MKKTPVVLNPLVFVAVLGMILAGCAALERNDAIDVEQLLAKAGFKKQVADTSAKLAHLKTLPQRKFSRHHRDGKEYYVYADATYCRCLYVGNAEAFQHYRDLEIQQGESFIEMNRPDIITGEDWSRSPWGPFD